MDNMKTNVYRNSISAVGLLLVLGMLYISNSYYKYQYENRESTLPYRILVGGESIAAALDQMSRPLQPYDGVWTIEEEHISELEEYLPKLDRAIFKTLSGSDHLAAPADSYFRQYAGITIKGTKYVYINAALIDDEAVINIDKSRAINVGDGGNYYWGGLYQLYTGKFSSLYINFSN